MLQVDASSILRLDARTSPDHTLVHVADVPRGPVRPGWQFSAVALLAQPDKWISYVDTAGMAAAWVRLSSTRVSYGPPRAARPSEGAGGSRRTRSASNALT